VDEIMKRLQAPFKPDEIEFRVGSTNKDKTKGLALAYVTNRAIQDRLDEVFGIFGWKNEFKEWKDKSQLCGISVLHNGEWITKWDGSDDSNMEATKGGLSDAMKRAAYQWGIGRYLYKLPDSWVDLKDGKYLSHEPQLPAWALPEGYTYQKPRNAPQQNKPVGNDNHQPGNDQGSKNGYGHICADCGNEIKATTKKTVEEILKGSKKYYQKELCQSCVSKRYKAAHPEAS
jgi:hypothetical protein